jgi:hypothetical protein
VWEQIHLKHQYFSTTLHDVTSHMTAIFTVNIWQTNRRLLLIKCPSFCLKKKILHQNVQPQKKTECSITFHGQMWQCSSTKHTSFLSGRENTVLQWTEKLNSIPAAAETWHFKCCMLMSLKGSENNQYTIHNIFTFTVKYFTSVT